MARTAGLYVHVPFCALVCPYCDFAVRTGGPALREQYGRWLRREVELYRAAGYFAEPIDTVYFGGGTPSLLGGTLFDELLAALRGELAIGDHAWLTLEANPEDVTADACRDWRACGVRTVSLGVQSLTGSRLRYLGRRHSPEQARRAVATARDAGFDAISVDLIYGLPGDSWDAVRADLEAVVELAPDHLSCYQLTVHDGTLFGKRRRRGELRELDDGRQGQLFLLTHRYLAEAGYPAYEVSNFARTPAARSRHNQKYWDHSPYLGLGPAAHSFDGRNRRWWHRRKLTDWQVAIAAGEQAIDGDERLSNRDLALEALMLGLRTTDGIDFARFGGRYGVAIVERNRGLLEQLAASGKLVADRARIRLTTSGLAVADGIAAQFDID